MYWSFWIIVAAILGLAVVTAIVLRKRKPVPAPPPQPEPASPPKPVRFAQPEELRNKISELRAEIGDEILPSLLKAADSDLERHLAIFDTPGNALDEDRRRALHSFVGIVETIGCTSLAETCRELQDRQQQGDTATQLEAEVLDQVRLLRAEIAMLLSGEIQGGTAPQSGGTS